MKKVVLFIGRFLFITGLVLCAFSAHTITKNLNDIAKMWELKENEILKGDEELNNSRKLKEVEMLRSRTLEVIKASPVCCRRERNICIVDEHNKVTSYEKEIKNDVIVRISSMNTQQTQKAMNINYNVNKKLYALTTAYNADIKKDDVLNIVGSGVVYKVIEIENVFFGEHTKEHIYKKTGIVESYY